MRILLLSLIFSIVSTQFVSALNLKIPKDSTSISLVEIEKNRLEEYRQDEDYNYTIKENEISWWENFKAWAFNLLLKLIKTLFGYEITATAIALFFKILIYGGIGLMLFLLLKLFLNVNTRSFISAKSNPSVVVFSEDEDIIQNENIPELIQKALTSKNYRLAVRYHYLLALKHLSDEHLITWEQQKTNDDYLSELKNKELSGIFSRITRIYDFVWYGDFEIDENRYGLVVPVFKSIIQNKGGVHG